jgi:uncharacterized protein (DUF302 family)
MYYIVESNKSFNQLTLDLHSSIVLHDFGVMHVHDLGNTLREKGFEFDEACKVFEVCSPSEAAKVLAIDIRLSLALPCRISVYTQQGKTKIGLIKPVQMLTALSKNSLLAALAKTVEERMIQIMDAAK